MKRKWQEQPDQPEIPGLRAALADMLAETLVTHTHDCVTRRAAQKILELEGVCEHEFFTRWAEGAYDA